MTGIAGAQERYEEGKRGTAWGMAANVILSAGKIGVGLWAGSEAVLADGVHNLGDVLGTLAVYIGLKVSQTPPDREHPYGHQKAEAVAQKVVGNLLIAAGILLLWTSVTELFRPGVRPPEILALWAAAASLVIKQGLYIYTRRLGERISSRSVLAAARDHLTDVWASGAAVVGIGAAQLGYPYMDPLAGAVVSLMVIRAGWGLAMEAIDELMDKFDDPAFLHALEEVARKIPGALGVQSLRARRMGPSILVDMEIGVHGGGTVWEGHAVAHAVRDRLMADFPEVTDVHIHMNPVDCEESH